MKLVDDKIHFLATAQEHKRTSATGIFLGGEYIERDCCVVNSCHLYVLNLCVSIFCFYCRIGCNILFKNGFDIPMKQLWLSY